jgi:hypothetical protein
VESFLAIAVMGHAPEDHREQRQWIAVWADRVGAAMTGPGRSEKLMLKIWASALEKTDAQNSDFSL